jgi:AraC-like DNA-binding protein
MASLGVSTQRLWPANSTCARVETLIAELLPTGVCAAGEVAKRLSMDRRTVQRKLAKEGWEYSEILQRARLKKMHDWYADPRTTLTKLAAELGFSSLSALTRWKRKAEGGL